MFVVKGTRGKGTVAVATPTASSALVTARSIEANFFIVEIISEDGTNISIERLAQLASFETGDLSAVPDPERQA